jgi:crotonobetainyl-CoA:carnitine CoA-transferase CaiB-like acyl-CoA transferase
MTDDTGIFSGLKVIDAANFIAAPAAATIMADFGAQVIKVEAPGRGDPYRGAARINRYPHSDYPHQWIVDNRNKKGIALDLKSEQGRAVLYRLVEDADVFITNAPLASRKRLGLRYADIRKHNQRVIHASVSAYGDSGAEAGRTGFDSTAWWARTGLMALVKPTPDAPPARSMPGMGDHPTAIALFGAIAMALYRRERTGEGSSVTTSLLANGLWSNAIMVQAALCGGSAEPRPGRDAADNALNNLYRTADGHWLHLLLMNQEHRWAEFAALAGCPDAAGDARFATPQTRSQHCAELIVLLDSVFARHDREYWQELLSANGFTYGAVATMDDVLGDRQMRDSGALRAMPDPRAGATHIVDSPIWMDGVAKTTPVLAPDLGQHTVEVLRDAGYDDGEIDRLKAIGAIA